jgi:hypothetical protein
VIDLDVARAYLAEHLDDDVEISDETTLNAAAAIVAARKPAAP